MLSTILRYEIEVIDHSDEKFEWKLRNVINPPYDLENKVIRGRFLWWTWERPYIVIFNEKEARIKARRKAFKIAKRLYPTYAVRVFVVFKFPEVDDPIRHRVWENGHYYSTH
jgi:hypothetical protein